MAEAKEDSWDLAQIQQNLERTEQILKREGIEVPEVVTPQLNQGPPQKFTFSATNFGKVDAEGSVGSSYRYPNSNVQITKDTDYVTFEFFKYKPPFKNTGGKSKADEYEFSANFSDGKNILGDKVKGKFGKNILMYMPEDVQSEYGANWSGAGFGFLAGRLLKVASGNFDIGQAFKDGTTAAKVGAANFIKNNANKALGTGVTTQQAIGGITGSIVNPNVEMMYESPEMRGFSLTYKMFASTEAEAIEIRNICTTFKKNMLPSFGEGTFISVPNVVRVTFMSGSDPNPFVSQFKPCAITNVAINYTPDGSWSSYAGGSPVATDITITFKELKMLFAEDIKFGGVSY